ncbi:MAG: RidA family protein [Sporomusaceae bacterium]|nr:RidA family protein [Sporomusaceae bacterium]
MQTGPDPTASKAAAHYSPATKAGNLICVSGQLPIDPLTGKKCGGGAEAQALQALQNIEAILQNAGAAKHNIIRTTAYISDISHWDEVNAAYARYFGEYKPARTIVPTRPLHYDCLIEIDAMAYLTNGEE